MTMILQGIGITKGMAVGNAWILSGMTEVHTEGAALQPEQEDARIQGAMDEVIHELEQLYHQSKISIGSKEAHVFKAHQLILQDPTLREEIENRLYQRRWSASHTVQNMMQEWKAHFLAMEDEYMRERGSDIEDVLGQVLQKLQGQDHHSWKEPTEPCILVAQELHPSQMARLNPNIVLGIVIEMGGRTSHTSILAQSMNIPTVVGVGGEIHRIQQGDPLLLIAGEGKVCHHPTAEQMTAYQAKRAQQEEQLHSMQRWIDIPSQTADGTRIPLEANIGGPHDLKLVNAHHADGIGLFRTELLYLHREQLPDEGEQLEIYREVVRRMGSRPVTVRTLDIGGDKSLPGVSRPHEDNPFLGLRAIRLCLQERTLWKNQLRALLQAGAEGKLKILFPMIATIEELREAKQVLAEAQEELHAQGLPHSKDIEIGMMMEIPSAVMLTDLFANEVDFMSIGTNDLLQYTMAADRMNEQVAHLNDPLMPGHLRLLNHVITTAHAYNVDISICGEMGADPEAIPLLLGMGLRKFSVNPSALLETKKQIGRWNIRKCEQLTRKAMQLSTANEIRLLVQAAFEEER
jgi:phosphotransferase system enzyme I (PtsI)